MINKDHALTGTPIAERSRDCKVLSSFQHGAAANKTSHLTRAVGYQLAHRYMHIVDLTQDQNAKVKR